MGRGVDLGTVEERIASIHRGRKWLVIADAAAGTTSTVDRLNEHGAAGVMVIASTEGTGDLPEADRIHYTRTGGDTIMDGIRSFMAAVERPGTALSDAVRRFDPSEDAMVLGAGFSRRSELAGRPIYGRREPSWGALEDKTTVDSIWDAAGIAAPPHAVVPLRDAPQAAAELAGDLGTVWVADNRRGWHGGAEFTRRVRFPDEATAAVTWFGRHARRVRITPFLEGIPCSIHGFVTDDGVAVFRPVELYILRRLDEPTFYYARVGTFWDPPREVRSNMRSAARRVADVLVDRVGYRGGFGIDGVCTADGFRPTELNPRLSAGLSIQARTADIPLGDVERLMLEDDLAVDPRDLEDTIVSAADGTRSGSFFFPTASRLGAASVGFEFDERGAPALVDADEVDDAGIMRSGPATFGAVIMAFLKTESTPVGPSTAPLAPPLMALAREHWGIDLPPVEAARDVCR